MIQVEKLYQVLFPKQVEKPKKQNQVFKVLNKKSLGD
jgi:hypothetical protein